MEGRGKKSQSDWWIRLKASLPNSKNGMITANKPFSKALFDTAPAAGLLIDKARHKKKKK
jgi:hypothetical protein